jgi:hypothetical protein
VLRGHPGVADVAVVGVPSPEWGESPVAWVVPADGAPAPDALRAWANERLGKTQRLAGLRYLAELPRSDIGKVLKRDCASAGPGRLEPARAALVLRLRLPRRPTRLRVRAGIRHRRIQAFEVAHAFEGGGGTASPTGAAGPQSSFLPVPPAVAGLGFISRLHRSSMHLRKASVGVKFPFACGPRPTRAYASVQSTRRRRTTCCRAGPQEVVLRRDGHFSQMAALVFGG